MNPTFKYSGVHWIGKVPSNWNVLALKRYAHYISRGRSPDYTDNESEGIPIINQACIYWGGLKLEKVKFQDPNIVTGCRGKVCPGDLLINSTGTGTLGRVGVFNLDGDYLADSHVTIIRSGEEIFSQYLYYLLQTDVYQGYIYSVLAAGATNQIELSREGLSNTPIIVPPNSQQKSIARFLDRKTAAIDTLIAKKQRLIQLLEEKRTALINQAVTKGLNLNIPMKDSGICWIGETPAHWQVSRISRIAQKITNGYVGPTRDILRDKGIPYIQSLHVKAGKILFERRPYYVEPEWSQIHAKSILRTDDILIVQTGAETGQCSIVNSEFEGANCHALIIIRTTNKCIGRYLLHILRSNYGNQALESIQTGALHEHLNCTLVKDISVLIPPIDEQIQIVREVDKETKGIEDLMGTTKLSIEKLQEYRRSLITAAVTGKLEISEVETDV